ncbi:MAG TPA: metallopeptidase TldD-related protein [Streptosporangiaceae bacterium]
MAGERAGASAQELTERALAASRTDECVVIAREFSAANLRWAGNTLTTNGVESSRRLTVIAIIREPGGASAGVVSATVTGPGQVAGVVELAERAAGQCPPAADAEPLPRPAELAGAGPGAGAGWDEPPAETGIGVLGRVARELGGAFEAAAGQRQLYGYAEHTMTTSYLGTSAGLRLRHVQPAGSFELTAKGAAPGASAWAATTTRDFTDVDVTGMADGLAQRLGWARRRVELPPGRYETLLPPTAVADLMICVSGALGARDTLDGRTVFSRPGGGTALGERLADLELSLRSDPGQPEVACAPFVLTHSSDRMQSVFDNGQPLAATEWISGGTLAALVQTRHSAAQASMPLTPSIDNLILDVPLGTVPLPEMIAQTSRGLLLTSLYYVREVDSQTLLATGLTRDGVYLIENGEVTGAVNNFRFNESPAAMLARTTQAGPAERTLAREFGEYVPRTVMAPLRVEGFHMSSVSQAT